jgi:glycerophosphoryl diester phosphodiesterase
MNSEIFEKMKVARIIMAAFVVLIPFGCMQQPVNQVAKIQQYSPENSVIAHRGTIYWAPELTEAAFRWSRNTGADYLELDVQRTKDGVLVIIHDKTFKRTTDISDRFPERTNDLISSFTYEEVMKLDAGSAFNALRPEQAREAFKGQDVLVFEDVFRIAEGKMIKRNSDGTRVFSVDSDGKYKFEYIDDPADAGHRPGIYIETKAPENYPGMEEQIYEELTSFGWNPLEDNSLKVNEPYYIDGKVNIGNTRGKILLQTFSRPGMENFQRLFRGEVLTSFLISNPKTNEFAKKEVRDEIITYTLKVGAQFIGTNLGEENDGLSPVFSEEIRAAGLKCNVYSFNTVAQMEKYFGTGSGSKAAPLLDGMITNRSDLTIDFYFQHKVRDYKMEWTAEKILEDLGY